jgi:hypothetical protein
MDSTNQATREILVLGMEHGTALDSKYSYHKKKKEKKSENCLMTSHTFALTISYK